MSQETVPELAREEIKREAVRRATERARIARWDLDVAVFLFVVLIIVIILLFQGIGLEIVALVAIFGLTMVWVVGWRRGRQLYRSFYNEEFVRLERELNAEEEREKREKREKRVEKTIEETIEETVQRALRERLK
ncbi:MAG: hypothetical protein GH158_01755 [Dehalococcoidia bacterium]|nr:hypothetical protein [Dehalococcoidia bacterium]